MVSTQLQRAKECSKSGSRPHITAQGVPHRTNQRWSIDQCPHLGDMSRVDNEEEVGRESIGQARNDAYPGVNAHKHHSNHHQNHSPQCHIHRAINTLDEWRCGVLNILLRVLNVDKVGRHSREHISRPLWVLARSLTMLLYILRHSRILRDITLRERLAVELRSIEVVANKPETHHSHNPGCDAINHLHDSLHRAYLCYVTHLHTLIKKINRAKLIKIYEKRVSFLIFRTSYNKLTKNRYLCLIENFTLV